MKKFQTTISIVILLLLLYISFFSLMPQSGTPSSISKTEFSTERALVHLKEIAKAPHYIGTNEHEKVRAYLVKQLEDLGLSPQVQEGFIMNPTRKSLNKAKNIIAKIKGSENGKALLLMSHYDSALIPSYGASDAGSGVVTIIESVRAYLASRKTPKNDILIVFTDAEEVGLNGVRLFVKEHPWAKNIGVALNFEARGSGGPSNMIVETNKGNKKLIKSFIEANVKYPTASSLMYSIYKMLPNDTDSTILREEADIDGFFFAFIDDHYDYHTANDTFENLDIATLQHQGEYLLPLIHYFAEANISSLKSDKDQVYINIPIFKFISYPFSWIYPMLIIAFLVFVSLVGYGFRKKVITVTSIMFGFIPFILSLILCGLVGFYGWSLIKYIYPHYNEIQHGFTYNGHTYISFFVLLSLGILFFAYHIFSKITNVPSLIVAPLFIWLLINMLVAIYLKGAAFFILPIFFGLFSFWILLIKRTPNIFLLSFLCAFAIFLFAPHIQSFPIGLGLKMLVASTVFTVLLFGLLLPVIGFYKNKKLLSIVFFLLAGLFFVRAHLESDFSSERQKPNSLLYYNDLDDNASYWVTYDTILDAWTRQFFGDEPNVASNYLENASGSKYNSGYRYAAEAPKKEIPLFETTLKIDTLINGIKHVTFIIVPQRNINQLSLYTEQDLEFNSISFNGQSVPIQDKNIQENQKIKTKEQVRYYVSDNDSLEVSYTIKEDTSVTFTVMEYSYDLMRNPLFKIKKRPIDMMPKPFVITDAIITKKNITIP